MEYLKIPKGVKIDAQRAAEINMRLEKMGENKRVMPNSPINFKALFFLLVLIAGSSLCYFSWILK